MHAQMVSLLRACTYKFRGRLSGDPELRTFESGTMVANASLAVDFPDKKRDDTDKTDWFRLEVWGEDAERFADTLKKGQLVDVEGRVRSDSYVSKKNGETVNQWVIKVHKWEPVGTPPAAKPATTAGAAAPAWNTSQADPASDEEIPF